MKTLQECKDEVARGHCYSTWVELCKNGNHDGTPDDWFNEAAYLFASQSLPVYGQWVDVKERLPDKGQVIVFDGERIFQCFYFDSWFYIHVDKRIENITHWTYMPLPPSPGSVAEFNFDPNGEDKNMLDTQILQTHSKGSVDVEEKKVDGLGDSSGLEKEEFEIRFQEFFKSKGYNNEDYYVSLESYLNGVKAAKSVKEVSREGEDHTEDGKDIILRIAMELGAVFQVQFVEDDGNAWTVPVNLTPERLKRLDDVSIRKIRIEFKL